VLAEDRAAGVLTYNNCSATREPGCQIPDGREAAWIIASQKPAIRGLLPGPRHDTCLWNKPSAHQKGNWMKQEEILQLVYAAIDDVNALTASGEPFEKHPSAALLGGDQGMDSLTFVNLVVALEEQIATRLGVSVVLVDENTMSLQEHPFKTVGTLAKYVETLVAAQGS
jgi:acyl carrier protein